MSYTIPLPVLATPMISPAGGFYPGPTSVTISGPAGDSVVAGALSRVILVGSGAHDR